MLIGMRRSSGVCRGLRAIWLMRSLDLVLVVSSVYIKKSYRERTWSVGLVAAR